MKHNYSLVGRFYYDLMLVIDSAYFFWGHPVCATVYILLKINIPAIS